MPQVTTVCLLHTLLPEPTVPGGLTAIDKWPVPTRVPVGPLGLAGDRSMDVAHHGGEEFALYLYADEDAAWWSAELGRQIDPGLFGENLRTSGLDVSGLVVGQRLRIGEDGLVVAVTAPRNPCVTFARRMGVPQWVRRFAEHRAPGAYVQVVESGSVGRGDAIESLSVPAHGITVADLTTPALPGAAETLLAAHDAGQVVLGPRMHRGAVREAARGNEGRPTGEQLA